MITTPTKTLPIGARMKISPYLTHKQDWVEGNLIEIEHNTFRGLIYVVKTDSGEIFFSVADDFKIAQSATSEPSK